MGIISIIALFISAWALYINRQSFFLRTRPFISPMSMVVKRDRYNLQYAIVEIGLKNFGLIPCFIDKIVISVYEPTAGTMHKTLTFEPFSKHIIMPNQETKITGVVDSQLCCAKPLSIHIDMQYSKTNGIKFIKPKYYYYCIYGNPKSIGAVIEPLINLSEEEEWELRYSHGS